jgi:hypothetical protein
MLIRFPLSIPHPEVDAWLLAHFRSALKVVERDSDYQDADGAAVFVENRACQLDGIDIGARL